ncbi:MAG: serine/threonine-protein kinase, partial [Acidobacteriota bacterium]
MSSVSQLGKFEITGELGKGSFGIVYRGRDPHLNRDVAIKVCTLDDEELRQRFLREAAISGRLDHRNIVTVHEYSSDGPTPYLVQEFLSGSDLRQVIKERRGWSVEQRLDALLGIAEGLAYAHGEGVIHRDIKPANIRVDDDGRVKILDFGIAKLANDESRLTQKGVTMGTASYLPPEQVRGGDVDTRSD